MTENVRKESYLRQRFRLSERVKRNQVMGFLVLWEASRIRGITSIKKDTATNLYAKAKDHAAHLLGIKETKKLSRRSVWHSLNCIKPILPVKLIKRKGKHTGCSILQSTVKILSAIDQIEA